METLQESFNCPHCSVFARFEMTRSETSFHDDEGGYGDACEFGVCPNCNRMVVFAVEVVGKLLDYNIPSNVDPYQKSLVFPVRNRSISEDIVPEKYLNDYKEAIKVISISPKSSALLIRRMLESILKNEFQIEEHSLYDAISKFIEHDNIPFYIRDAADAIRNLGNLAAHQTFDTDTKSTVEIEKYEVEWLLDVIEALIDFAFIQPEILRERTEKLNNKLKKAGKKPIRTGSYD